MAGVRTDLPTQPARSRLLHRRDDPARTAVRAVLHRVGQSPRVLCRLHTESTRRVGNATSPAANVDACRARGSRQVPHSGPRSEIHQPVRDVFRSTRIEIIGRSRTPLKCSKTVRTVRPCETVRYVTRTRSRRCRMSVEATWLSAQSIEFLQRHIELPKNLEEQRRADFVPAVQWMVAARPSLCVQRS